MLRIILTVLIATGVGIGLGRVQTNITTSAFEERFDTERATLAEIRGEKTREEIIESSAVGTPRVEVVGGTQFNFGSMQHGAQRSHEFVVKNIGDGTLNLDMGGSTCKCTVGDLESSQLQPGEETIVKLTWTAQSIMRDFGQSATLMTNDPFQTEVKLVVSGQIAGSYVMQPDSLSLGTIADSAESKYTFMVFNYLPDSKELTAFSWSDPKTERFVKLESALVEIDAEEFPEHANAVNAHQVTVTILPGMPIGSLSGRVQFETDQGEDIGTLQLQVAGRVAGDIMLLGGSSLEPDLNRVTFGTVKSSDGAAVSIQMAVQGKYADDFAVEVQSVEPAKSLQVTIGEPRVRGERKFFPIKLEVPKGAPEVSYSGTSAASHGKVILKTNHEFTPEIPIFVRLIVTK